VAGGKSRKSGGVSRDLIAEIKRGPKKAKDSCGTTKSTSGKGGFHVFKDRQKS
jgi:hypothetical protein